MHQQGVNRVPPAMQLLLGPCTAAPHESAAAGTRGTPRPEHLQACTLHRNLDAARCRATPRRALSLPQRAGHCAVHVDADLRRRRLVVVALALACRQLGTVVGKPRAHGLGRRPMGRGWRGSGKSTRG